MAAGAALGRRRGFYRALLMQPLAAKEIRLFGLGDVFGGRLLADLLASGQSTSRPRRQLSM